MNSHSSATDGVEEAGMAAGVFGHQLKPQPHLQRQQRGTNNDWAGVDSTGARKPINAVSSVDVISTAGGDPVRVASTKVQESPRSPGLPSPPPTLGLPFPSSVVDLRSAVEGVAKSCSDLAAIDPLLLALEMYTAASSSSSSVAGKGHGGSWEMPGAGKEGVSAGRGGTTVVMAAVTTAASASGVTERELLELLSLEGEGLVKGYLGAAEQTLEQVHTSLRHYALVKYLNILPCENP